MSGGFRTPDDDVIDTLTRMLSELRAQVNELARPSGTQTADAVQKLMQLVNDLPGQIYAVLATAVNTGTLTTTGNAIIGGNATVAGNVTGGNVFAQSIATNITAGRVTVWGRTSDGFLGTATSSERFKTNIRPVDIDSKADAICQIVVSYFEYIDEVRKRDDPDYEFYVGAHYHVGTNMGAIAERMHELGLWEWVVYEREMVYEPGPIDDRAQSEEMFLPGTWVEQLKLDAEGEPIPSAIHDILIGWAALIVAQSNARRITAIEDRLTAAGI